jgi:hypothetical protein
MLAEVRAHGYQLPSVERRAIARQAQQLRATANWFGGVLDRTGARIGLLVDHGLLHMGFNRACGERGIPSVEIQHGVQIGNARYSAWRALPPGGYLELPSHFWCWTEQEAANVRAWSTACPRHEPIVGGNLWLRAWLDGSAPLADNYDAEIRRMSGPPGIELSVLVTLSTGFSGERRLQSLRKAIAAAPDGWRWWLRAHPTMQRDEFDAAVAFLGGGARNGAILPTAAQDLPLYAQLRRTDVHVTQLSTTVIEAQQFRVPSVAIDPMAGELYPDQQATGWMAIAPTAEEIVDAVRRQAQRMPTLPPPPDPRSLPAPSALLEPLLASSPRPAR